MNVWIRRARKSATCTYELCPDKTISNNQYFVVCQWYMNTPGGKKWRKQKFFHTQCWIDQAVAILESRTVTETRGRRRLSLADSNRAARMKILRKRAALVQRAKEALKNERYDIVQRLGDKMEKCKVEIEQYGGVPKKW